MKITDYTSPPLPPQPEYDHAVEELALVEGAWVIVDRTDLAAARVRLARSFAGLSPEFRGPYWGAFEMISRMLDAGDRDAAIAHLAHCIPSPQYDAEQLEYWQALRADFLTALAALPPA
jgi:hypothetical protein